MNSFLRYLGRQLAETDRLLRGEATRPASLGSDTLAVSARGLAVACVVLAMFYGLCMSCYSLAKEVPEAILYQDPYGPFKQVLASMAKVPMLFGLTLLVTLPSLYVFNALVGSRLSLLGMIRLLVASITVNVAVLAALGTIVAFFSLFTTSYPFVRLINVAAFTVSGVLGLMFLLQTLHRLSFVNQRSEPPEAAAAAAAAGEPNDSNEPHTDTTTQHHDTALDMPAGQTLGKHTQVVFRCWVVLFALVGAQMGWVLRPFIGSPHIEFTFFRDRQSNFFEAIANTIYALLTGGG